VIQRKGCLGGKEILNEDDLIHQGRKSFTIISACKKGNDRSQPKGGRKKKTNNGKGLGGL